jgi:hypothetical protein
VHVSVDNFGTGNSSLSSMQKLPVNAIKIDRSFVRQITTVPGGTAAVEAFIEWLGAFISGSLLRELKRLKIWSFCGHTIVTKPRGTFSAARSARSVDQAAPAELIPRDGPAG